MSNNTSWRGYLTALPVILATGVNGLNSSCERSRHIVSLPSETEMFSGSNDPDASEFARTIGNNRAVYCVRADLDNDGSSDVYALFLTRLINDEPDVPLSLFQDAVAAGRTWLPLNKNPIRYLIRPGMTRRYSRLLSEQFSLTDSKNYSPVVGPDFDLAKYVTDWVGNRSSP